MIQTFINRWRRPASSKLDGEFEIYQGGNRSAINVLIFTEYVNATYYISFDLPLKKLYEQGLVNFAVASQRHVIERGKVCWRYWHDHFEPDVVVMTRYGQPDGRAILDYFRQQRVPVIYHIDDDLLDIPQSLGSEIQQRHGDSQVVDTRRYLLQNCDLIYASTKHLAFTLQQRFPEQQITHGIYAPYLGELLSPVAPEQQTYPIIGYMGSKGHQHDLELVVPALEQLLEQRGDLHFETFGTIKMPKALKRFGARVYSHSVQQSYCDFLSTLAGLGWSIGLAPLVDAPFNRCKAPTKFIEYSACGIPVVASAISVYTDALPEAAGVFVEQDWLTALNAHLDAPEQRIRCLNAAQAYCSHRYSLDILQKQILNLFFSIKG